MLSAIMMWSNALVASRTAMPLSEDLSTQEELEWLNSVLARPAIWPIGLGDRQYAVAAELFGLAEKMIGPLDKLFTVFAGCQRC